MGGFAQCAWPIWRVDDLTHCFQQDYLKTVLPLVVVVTSFSLLLTQSFLRSIKAKRRRRNGYQSVATTLERVTSHTEILPDDAEDTQVENAETEGSDDTGEDGGGNDLTIGGGRIALARTNTKGSIVQADAPPAQNLSVIVEEAAILGLVVVNAIALATGAWGPRGSVAAITGLTVWLYVLVLASLRLFLGSTAWRVPRLWNHTAFIYGAQWLFTVTIFRSVVVHPSSSQTQVLVIVEFILTTTLFGLAVTTRKGNKTVLLEWEDGIPPSRESLASLLSLWTFAWTDAIIWEGWREPLTLDRVWNLLPRDKAVNVLADYRRAKKRVALWIHLLSYFKGMLIIQFLWATFGGLFVFAPTLLLKAILEQVENPGRAPINVLWLYVILLPLADLVRSLADNQALWLGRKICINIRAILVGEIYAKSLRRKAASGKDTVLGERKDAAQKKKQGWWGRIKATLGRDKKEDSKRADDSESGPSTKAKGGDDEQANLGTIINLMSVDTFKVSEITAYLHFLVAHAPTQLMVSVVLLYQVMGWSAIPGFIVMALLLPVNIAFGKGFNRTQKTIMAATDKRIHITNEVLSNIRIIKYFAWEARFESVVDEKRRVELKALRARFLLWATAVCVWNSVPILITFFTFLSYTLIEKKPLYPSIAFTAISLFMLLRNPLDQIGDMIAHVQESKVSIDRIEEFLAEEETEKFEQLGVDNRGEDGHEVIGFRDASFIWGSKDTVAEDGSMAFRLLDLNLDFKIGKLNVITGPTGSGKTSMLMALLGEMSVVKGRVFLPGGRSREEVRPDQATGLAETCAYVAQQAWLVNASIKANILFSAPFDEQRYRDVIVACALERDLEILDNGDETLVGEKGITLSGGQKQRISLARAVYSNSKHLLLDDCLSAVDSHTAQWIFNTCITGPLMTGRTCILVSHNIPLTVPRSDYVVMMSNGRIESQGSAQEMIASGKLGEEIQKSRPGSASASQIPSRVPSSLGESGATLVDKNGGGAGNNTAKAAGGAAPKKHVKQNAMDEEKATGAVPWPVVKLYLTSLGGWWFWVVALAVFGLQQGSGVASNLWVKEWSNQYTTEQVASGSHALQVAGNSHVFPMLEVPPTFFSTLIGSVTSPRNGTALKALLEPDVNASYYLIVLGLIGLAGALAAFFRDLWIFLGSLGASWKLHNRLMKAVSSAKFKFFDVTPLGQMMNRFSKDLENVDQEVAPVAIGVLSCALGIAITIILIAYITPGFLVAALFITMAYVAMGAFYLHASRDLKRLESVQRSPLFQQFGETLTGVTTIRAYGDERRFVRDNLTHINKQIRPFIYLWAANRWLAIRTDILGDLVAFFAGVFVIMSLGKIDAGSAGISLSYAIGFADNILWLVRLYAMNEQNMNSVERIKEYLDVEQEAPAVVEGNRPPENWPAHGSVEFINYSTRYRAELEPVLKNLTFKIAPRQKVGIVGRTGAGKSSLALALFRALEADQDGGKILVDGLDIGLVGLRDLREKITIVPQDPTLFMGTVRSNIDPFGLYSDDEVFDVLRRVQLLGPDERTASSSTAEAPTLAAEQEDVVTAEREDPAIPPAESMGRAAGGLPAPTSAQVEMAPPTPAIAITSDEVPATGSTDPLASQPQQASSSTPPTPTPTSLTAAAATNKNPFTDLASPVSESGSNLSQGQRQLVCLARALLRAPTVLVMDEATASIDYATDGKIQDTLRRLDATIVTIAHRLKTIADYDVVLVLDAGRVVERGAPWALLRDGNGGGGESGEDGGGGGSSGEGGLRSGVFRGMCEQSGEFEALREKAREAWERGRLVDDGDAQHGGGGSSAA